MLTIRKLAYIGFLILRNESECMEEMFDILDENGNNTGLVKKRSLVHKDGDWHKAVHIYIINDKKEVLVQRRSPNKDSDPNMLDISCAGHLTSGDDSITAALRELKEELNLSVNPDELVYITTLKRSPIHDDGFVDNEYDDLYLLHTTKRLDEMSMQKEEISELMFVDYERFKRMCREGQDDFVDLPDEYPIILDVLDREIA